MSVPPLQLRPISTSHYYLSGDVTIQDGAAIAPGVLIQADPNSRILIQRGACIGIGSSLHAYHGTLEIGEGANIGAEVLLIGQVTIGANACIGSASTILNCSIESGQVIPPGSLIGDNSRQLEELPVTTVVPAPVSEPANGEVVTPSIVPPQPAGNSEAATPAPSGVSVYGQMYVNQLLVKMFPNSQRLNNPPSPPNQSSLPDDPWND